MFLRFIKAIINALVWFLSKIFFIAVKAINFLHLWLILIYLAACGIIQLIFQIFSKDQYFVWFIIGLVVCFVITCYSFIFKAKRQGNKQDKKEERQDVKQKKKSDLKKNNSHKYEHVDFASQEEFSYPLYYKVAGNEDFLMAEFADRYELYLEKDGKFQYVRTDYKNSPDDW